MNSGIRFVSLFLKLSVLKNCTGTHILEDRDNATQSVRSFVSSLIRETHPEMPNGMSPW